MRVSNKRDFKSLGFALAALSFAICSSVAAQQPKKIFRIGYLSTQPTTYDSRRRREVQQALRALGYAEGQNISLEYRSAEGDTARLATLATQLVERKVDLIIVMGGLGPMRPAAGATKTIPIIIGGGGLDPVEVGLINSLAHPGGNITGYIDVSGYLGGKRLELLKEAVPNASRIAVLFQTKNPRNMFELKEVIPNSARALKLAIVRGEVRDLNDFDRAFTAISKERPDGIFVLGGPLMNRTQERTAAFATKSRLPSIV